MIVGIIKESVNEGYLMSSYIFRAFYIFCIKVFSLLKKDTVKDFI